MYNRNHKEHFKEHFLKPGYIFCSARSRIISTVLGSGVAVVLYDHGRCLGAMNNFTHPWLIRGEVPTTLGGQPSILRMLRICRLKGASMPELEAQIFGGAAGPGAVGLFTEIGRLNLQVAEEFLALNEIRVVSRDIGGSLGRKIVFNSGSGEVLVAKVSRIRSDDWYPGIKDLSKVS